MKINKIIYWVSTVIIFLFEGVMPALFGGSEESRSGMSHLGYPYYFGVALICFKVAGAIVLILPVFKGRIKEWAYAGFTFDFIFASISHAAIDGIGMMAFFPIIILAILGVSYFYYHKIQKESHRN
ncbi:DoxX family protein [Arcticibacter eurypsychrophilus]|uniref:DoxX family protein n=1 Tax=Arcticibacter eurypsychrophilus TaxID=1434752 RepID=UPI00084DB21A|nr:DoxX family protein [Arcticibacter eurypsychrophilus]